MFGIKKVFDFEGEGIIYLDSNGGFTTVSELIELYIFKKYGFYFMILF